MKNKKKQKKMIVRFAKCTQPDLAARARLTQRAQVVGIPYSNFCELGRWALSAAYPYDEIERPPLAHILPTLALRFSNGSHVSSSSRMLGRGGGSPTGVPVAVMPDGSVLVDSWDILDSCAARAGWSKLGLTDELRRLLDHTLGPLARKASYASLLKPENKKLWDRLLTYEQSWAWRTAWHCGLGGMLAKRLIKSMDLNDEGQMKEVYIQIENGLRQAGSLLEEKGTPFFAGAHVGAADVAVAAILAPFILPKDYCEGKFNFIWNQLEDQDAEFRSRLIAWRATKIGRHVVKVYETRLKCSIPSTTPCK